MRPDPAILQTIRRHGADILACGGMQASRGFVQHGEFSIYDHCVLVTAWCLVIARRLHLRVDEAALVRGALLHDYFLYDWHVRGAAPRQHALYHARQALENARRDFALGPVEQNMIESHMFPVNFCLPRHKESVVLCLADKLSTLTEVLHAEKIDLDA